MKRKLLFSCEKRKGRSFVLLSADISHPWQVTQRIGFVLRLQPLLPPPSLLPSCQSAADMRDLWMKPESMRSVASAWLSVSIGAGWKTSSEHITTGHLGYGLIRIKEQKTRTNVYLLQSSCFTLLLVYTHGNKHVLDFRWLLLCWTYKECRVPFITLTTLCVFFMVYEEWWKMCLNLKKSEKMKILLTWLITTFYFWVYGLNR